MRYLTEDERERYRLFVHRGLLWSADTARPYDTSGGVGGRAIYVMDRQGNLYASTVEIVGGFHHSSLLAGEPVAGAGELTVQKGLLQALTGACPTYPSDPSTRALVLSALVDQGLGGPVVEARPTGSG